MKPRLIDVLETLKVAISDAINAAGVTPVGQVFPGQPLATELVKILAQNDHQWQLTLFPRPGAAKNTSRYEIGTTYEVGNPNSPLIATVSLSGSTWIITFSGSNQAGLNIHTFVGAPAADAAVQTAGNESLSGIASLVAAQINALDSTSGLGTVTATPVGAAVHIVNSGICVCNVGASGQFIAEEVGRRSQQIIASIWAPDMEQQEDAPAIRAQIADALDQSVGTSIASYLNLSDGTPMHVEYMTEFVDDQAQSAYSAYALHVIYEVEYAVVKLVEAATIEVVEAQITVGDAPETTFLSSGGS